MKKLAVILVLLALAGAVFAWDYTNNVGGSLDESRALGQCADGGFFLAGRSNAWAEGGYTTNPYDYQFFIVKVDSMGLWQWTNNYGQNGNGFYDACWCIVGTPDSGAIMVGKTQSPIWTDPPAGYSTWYDDALVIRVDKNGDTLWTQDFGGGMFDRCWWIGKVPGVEEYWMCCPTQSYGPGMPDETGSTENIWIIKIDGDGNMINEYIYSDPTQTGHSDCRWGTVSHDGGCVVVGCTDMRDTSYFHEERDSVVTYRISNAVCIKVNAACEYDWHHEWSLSTCDHYPRSITTCNDSGYVMTMYDRWPSWTLAMRLNSEGDTMFTKYMAYNPEDSTSRLANFTGICTAPGGGYYLSGSGQGMAWMLKIDDNLDQEWYLPYDRGDETENFYVCLPTVDGGVVAAGYTKSLFPAGYYDVYAARATAWGEDYYDIAEAKVDLPEKPAINLYPNPFNAAVNVDVTNVTGEYTIEVYDITGARVDVLDSGEHVWQPSANVPSGTYMFSLKADNARAISKGILLK